MISRYLYTVSQHSPQSTFILIIHEIVCCLKHGEKKINWQPRHMPTWTALDNFLSSNYPVSIISDTRAGDNSWKAVSVYLPSGVEVKKDLEDIKSIYHNSIQNQFHPLKISQTKPPSEKILTKIVYICFHMLMSENTKVRLVTY